MYWLPWSWRRVSPVAASLPNAPKLRRTPCRIGSVRGVETIDRIAAGDPDAIPILTDLCNTMKWGSLCALGGFAPFPVMSALTHFPDEFSGRGQPRKEAAE